ncbi:hypothetical protein ACOSQ2_003278 [Xanthoceras sorbifolium]
MGEGVGDEEREDGCLAAEAGDREAEGELRLEMELGYQSFSLRVALDPSLSLLLDRAPRPRKERQDTSLMRSEPVKRRGKARDGPRKRMTAEGGRGRIGGQRRGTEAQTRPGGRRDWRE